ncbi:replication factor C subunit 3-like [Humulus lupulus]|uniref:replication factor C subunit 3-like n=1 Tax=Humulus lupulus TaxID=3486 RepID=UPI002B413E01|nr:replication factor C subunit 3-like [Humulus lupulus]
MPRSAPIPPSLSSSSCSPKVSNLGSRRSRQRHRQRDRLHRSSPSSKKALATPPPHKSFGRFLPFGKRRSSSSNNIPQKAELTKANLEAHLARTRAEEEDDNQKNSPKGYSPYYRGLLANTTPTQSYLGPGGGKQAVPESHVAPPPPPPPTSAAFTRSSFASTIIIRLQEALGSSCFPFKSTKNKEKDKNDDDDDGYQPPVAPAMASPGLRLNSTATNSTIAVVDRPPLLSMGRGDDSDGEKKPLRESFQGPAHDHDHDLHDHQAEPPLSTEHHEPTVVRRPSDESEVLPGQRIFVWADKYRPKALEDFICNRNKAIELQLLARTGECGHFIFQGPAGVGKRTMIWAMLREAFGPDSIQASEEFKVFNLQGEEVGSIEVLVKNSPRLLEVNISDIKGYEKHVIYELIKENISQSISYNNTSLPCKPPDNCRAIIFYGVEKLSSDAILYIKWLLERYNACNKIFFCCSDLSKLQAIKNLCTVVQLLPPSRTEIIKVLKLIAEKEGIDVPQKLAEKITDASKKNLRQAIRSFEATWLKHYPFTEDQEVLNGWEDDIANIAKNMIEEQGPKLLYIIRGKLQNLVEHDVSPDLIFQSLVEEVKKHLDNETLKRRVHNLYVEYSKTDESIFESDKALAHPRKSTNAQQFMRIEEFIAKFMSCYKTEATKIMQQENEDHNSKI